MPPPAAHSDESMLTARAATSPTVSNDTNDWGPSSSLQWGVNGSTSVGRKAVDAVRLVNR